MSTITKQEYMEDPCGVSSLPYWKMREITVPETMLIRHDRCFDRECLTDYADDPYFRLYHDLQAIPAPRLPDGFCLCDAAPAEYAAHICQCYGDVSMDEEEIRSYFRRGVYAPDLWIAVRETESQQIVATGIAELDKEVCEGILEWVQVSPAYRGRGLGTYIVAELLSRIAKGGKFATVSGRVNNSSKPEALYRKCGFRGNDVWHILRKRQ